MCLGEVGWWSMRVREAKARAQAGWKGYTTNLTTESADLVIGASSRSSRPTFLDCSFGFRPRRAAHDGLQVLVDEAWRGRRWVVETDIANCFSAIPQEKLMQAVEERVSDQAVLKLLRAMLRAGVMHDGVVRREVSGTPQGGVISPLLCNVYLHRLDRVWDVREHGVLVRYADDAVVMCRSGSRPRPRSRG